MPPTVHLVPADGRPTVSLHGAWRVIPDPYETGYRDYRWQPSDRGWFRDEPPADPAALVEYDFDAAPTLEIPGDWNTQREDLRLYEGVLWHRRTFVYTPTGDTRLFLRFGAVNYRARVWLNGTPLGEHVGGFTPFAFDATTAIREGNNCLVLMVDNRREAAGVPTLNTDWGNYGGITRPVTLVETPRTHIRSHFVRLDAARPGRVLADIEIAGADGPVDVTVEIPELKASVTGTCGRDGHVSLALEAGPARWHPERPRLYDLVLRTPQEELRDRVGFRTIAVDGTRLLLNGVPVFLRGISIHEEAPFRGGRLWSPEEARTLLHWAVELGCNFVRLAHYPHNEAMVREAERLGLLVWAEIPVYWTIHWEDPATLGLARDMLEAMIRRDRNRANVILWSVANETPVTAERNAFLRALVAHGRSLDNTRLFTAAMERVYTDPGTLLINDPLGADLDVLGCNEYLGWYDGPPEKCDRVRWESAYQKPLIVSEFGAGARAGHRGAPTHRWTEEYQDAVYRHQLAMLDRIPFLAGISPWILMDFRSPRRPLAGVQDGWNRKGLVSERGHRKLAFHTLREYYARRASPSPTPT